MPAYNPWTSLLEERGAAHRAVAAFDRLTRKGGEISGGSTGKTAHRAVAAYDRLTRKGGGISGGSQ
jgi:hypothetical protein